ncbi:MAG TPA: FAD-binding oxidoreductase, partial [Terriglobales bacterium]
KSYLRNVLRALRPQIELGTPIVVLEPSCASVLRDELHNLFPDDRLANKLREQTVLLSELLEKHGDDVELPSIKSHALVQGHCHHKSVLNYGAEQNVINKLGLDATFLNSGCCGMAGSFGFEQDKAAVSVAVGERVLLPEVRKASPSTLIVADGFSCREQIAQETDRRALHLAEVIRLGLQPANAAAPDPETGLFRRRTRSRRMARLRAAAALSLLAVGGILLRKAIRH